MLGIKILYRTHAAALWDSFQQSVHTPTSWSPQSSNGSATLVKIEKKYLFAGEMVVEIVEVPEDSQDAKKWPRWEPPNTSKAEKEVRMDNGAPPSQNGERNASVRSFSQNILPSTPTPISTAPPPSNLSTTPTPLRKPGPRKPKTTLATPPSLLGGPKPKKLTTLDKSAMDWKAHVDEEQSKSGLKDDLEANRRGGGYLEKVDFLKRVDERKEDKLEGMKNGKRRRV
ncbi:hypothetical protein BDN72DRAFT_828736 [Pluteus cervinus]|uniref:Uncharacterized protein n=1 Tax=Pluteus cervinus TaxID=181527 RepID=A0ACD3A4S1_9AGAR|nr:hypothetical protein BDN72DRAFT_828736 [Pluteus cervinus]